MDLHEYCSKELLMQHGIPVPHGVVVSSTQSVTAALKQLGTQDIVVKAQVLSGGRGKAGGVKLVSKAEVEPAVQAMLGSRLVTKQTTDAGLPVERVLLEEKTEIKQEFYLAMLLDREHKSITVLASKEGGVDIEAVAASNPEAMVQIVIHDAVYSYHIQTLGRKLGLDKSLYPALSDIVMKMYGVCMSSDVMMLEINPLVLTQSDQLICLDAKINIDQNALTRQTKLSAMRDFSQEDKDEVEADKYGLSYVSLDGNIGCMVNGAGLAMATMDMIKFCGGNPANFLDVGGDATEERVMHAFRIIGQDPNVKVILVNIFGGIVRCDLIAQGILSALKQVSLNKPVVVRLEGHNADLGRKLLLRSDLPLYANDSFKEAAVQAVQLSKEA
ncbi:ADP-forming succinate--CoA ligase subunit beta [Candidatus Comchoanobacter bicostacola]|uniref:Succinate--CoA ligase [ADP-forming] subunit beta n=1 Tax=Candidatus Comchoanobacter bicostacola TaxID=2919598 RepID=A0ABY5DK75_9GAMM|nr:ADP-forming succinate--CoA ligase subunit beta [Candidatus Comchoanobacter bicostacola]UTC24883.1 ADP-forming succinate--CoA ligase subunit beta [Candidatus Comchoanobacter bicostacola]